MRITRRAVISWIPKALLIIVGTILLWRSRILQVTAFLAAAGLKRKRHDKGSWLHGSRVHDWRSVPLPTPVVMKQPNLAVLLTYHPEYQFFDPLLINRALAKATELNAAWLRTDVRWRELMPDGDHLDANSLNWYRGFLARATAHGFQNLLVLSTPPDALLVGPSSRRIDAWSKYVGLVTQELAPYCQCYQLMNEPNNPVYAFFSRELAPRAIAVGAAIIKSHDSRAQVSVNVSMEIWGWRQYLADLLFVCGNSVDIVGLDHYPGTWTIGRQDRWRDVYEIAALIHSAEPGSVWFKRRLAIMETGFSTNTRLRNEEQQAQYFHKLTELVARLRRTYNGVAFIGLYELCDSDSRPCLDPEAHFGLLTSDLKPKRAFSAVQQLVSAIR